MSREVEIVPDQMGGFEILGKRYEVSAATDSVIRFVDNKFDYLRYLDPEEHAITLHWLGQAALGSIVAFGIPETRQRKTIQECEYGEYLRWHNLETGETEPLALPPGDPIDAEVQKAHEHLDAEIAFYLKEWTE